MPNCYHGYMANINNTYEIWYNDDIAAYYSFCKKIAANDLSNEKIFQLLKSGSAYCLPGRKESKCKDPAQGEDGQPDGEPHKGGVLPAQAQLFQVPALKLL